MSINNVIKKEKYIIYQLYEVTRSFIMGIYYLLNEQLNYYKWRKIKKIIKFLDYDTIVYSSDSVSILMNEEIGHNYHDWGEFNNRVIRIRDISNITLLMKDLKHLFNNDYRIEKLKRIIK